MLYNALIIIYVDRVAFFYINICCKSMSSNQAKVQTKIILKRIGFISCVSAKYSCSSNYKQNYNLLLILHACHLYALKYSNSTFFDYIYYYYYNLQL